MISTDDEARLIVGATVSFSGVGGTGIGSGLHEEADNAVTTVAAVGIVTSELTLHDKVDAAIHVAASVVLIAFFILSKKVCFFFQIFGLFMCGVVFRFLLMMEKIHDKKYITYKLHNSHQKSNYFSEANGNFYSLSINIVLLRY